MINASDSVNGPLKGSAIFLHVFYSNKGALTKNLYQIAYAYSSARERMFIRQYRRGSNDWSSWSEILSSASIGDGIRINNGIISVPEYEGATASTAGTSGLVPPATAGEQENFLTGGGDYKPALSTKGGVLTGSIQINDTANVIGTAPAENAERGIFIADKNGAIMGGFDNVQRASDNVKWTQMFAKTNNGNITSLAAVAHEDGTGEIVTYHPIQISGVQLNQTIDGKTEYSYLVGIALIKAIHSVFLLILGKCIWMAGQYMRKLIQLGTQIQLEVLLQMVVGHGKRTACSGQMAVQQYGTGMVKAVNHNGCGEVMTVKACTSTTPPTSV